MGHGDQGRDTGARTGIVPQDVVLTPDTDIGAAAGATARFDANVNAIRVLKVLEAEKRQATTTEQSLLTRYSGFGDSQFEQAFNQYPWGAAKETWKARGDALRSLLTKEEYHAVERSRINAFYTTPQIIRHMWSALDRLGMNNIANPRILEPSAGSGRFLGLQPTESSTRSHRIAVELDKMTGSVLKNLYPQTEVYNGVGFQKAPVAPDSIDIAISNVPFGKVPVTDRSFKGSRSLLTKQIHNYFFGKTLNLLRPGGVLAFITTHNTMDASTAKPMRKLLHEQADLVGMIRLPKGAFPDTEVVTDIVFMRKRGPDEKPGDDSWVGTSEIEVMAGEGGNRYPVKLNVNDYYLKHPDMVVGQHAASGSQYRADSYSVELAGGDLGGLLTKAVNQLPSNVIAPSAITWTDRADATPTPMNVKGGSFVIDDAGLLMVKSKAGTLTRADLSREDTGRVKGMLAVRDAARKTLVGQLGSASESELAILQLGLNEEYDRFVKINGPINATPNASLMKDDPDAPFLRALENWSPAEEKELRNAKTLANPDRLKMPIFRGRVVNGTMKHDIHDDSDAMAVSLNETGHLDFKRIGELLGRSPEESRAGLHAKRLIYKNPVGDWEPADQYLSGDIRDKLSVAEIAAAATPAFQTNVKALKEVLPPPVSAGQIGVRLGSAWVPLATINQFIKDTLNTRDWRGKGNYFEYSPTSGEWLNGDKIEAPSAMLVSEYGTERMPAGAIIDRILNGKAIEVNDKDTEGKAVRNAAETVAAREKADAIIRKFQEWVWQDPDRAAELVKIYNTTFNSTRPRVFDGSHLDFPGMSLQWHKQLHKHQRDAIWRVVQDRTALLSHEVGFGKSAVMISAGMELRRLGLSRKNMYVVPKLSHGQFQQQFREIYPFASILAPNDEDFTPEKRKEFVSRVATGDWDAVILTNEQFRSIPVKPETEAKFLREELDTLRAALAEEQYEQEKSNEGSYRRRSSAKSPTHKQLEATILRFEEKLNGIMATIGEKTDDTMHFEDLGVDQLIVDEADNFKNLHFTTRKTRVKGLPNSNSIRSWDIYQKIRYLQQQGKGKGIVFATGTPVANTIAEVYTMMRYLQPEMLEAKGIQHFDSWANTFGTTTEDIEQTVTGDYRSTQRFSKFDNIPELSALWQQVNDVRVSSEVPEIRKIQPRLVDDQGRPKRTVVKVNSTKAQLAYMDTLIARADQLKNVDPTEDNMLKIANDARLAALDLRMVDDKAEPNPEGKIAVAAKNVAKLYKEMDEDRGTQLVFLDMGTPKAKDKVSESDDSGMATDEQDTAREATLLRDVYAALKNHMIAAGIPANKIAFIHDAKTPIKKQIIQNQMNTGELRVLIGSTGKMGSALNIQKKAGALHHLDVPWRPRDLEQREGRIIRQGNDAYGPKIGDNGEILDPGKGVKIFNYVTEKSFDGYMWQTIEAKAKAIKSLMKRNITQRTLDDVDSLAMSASEAKAVASGNPDVFKLVELKNNLGKLKMLQATHTDRQIRARDQIRMIPSYIASLQRDIKQVEEDATRVKPPPEKFDGMSIHGKHYSERADAGVALADALHHSMASWIDFGTYRGFKVRGQKSPDGFRLSIINPDRPQGVSYDSGTFGAEGLTPAGLTTRVDNLIRGVGDRLKSDQQHLTEAHANLATYEKQAETPFERLRQLQDVEIELTRVEKRLQGKNESDTSVVPGQDSADLVNTGEVDAEIRAEIKSANETASQGTPSPKEALHETVQAAEAVKQMSSASVPSPAPVSPAVAEKVIAKLEEEAKETGMAPTLVAVHPMAGGGVKTIILPVGAGAIKREPAKQPTPEVDPEYARHGEAVQYYDKYTKEWIDATIDRVLKSSGGEDVFELHRDNSNAGDTFRVWNGAEIRKPIIETGITSTPKKPMDVSIKAEPEPLNKTGWKWVAYDDNGQPLHMAGEFLDELKMRVEEHVTVNSYTTEAPFVPGGSRPLTTRPDAPGRSEIPFPGGVITDDAKSNNIWVKFSDKPSFDVRSSLKRNGFHWKPNDSAWQRSRSPSVLAEVKKLVKAPEVSAAQPLPAGASTKTIGGVDFVFAPLIKPLPAPIAEKAHPEEWKTVENLWHMSRGEGYGGNTYHVGQIIHVDRKLPRYEKLPEWVAVVRASQKYYREDGMSFGVGDESGYVYSAEVRTATPDEVKGEEIKRGIKPSDLTPVVAPEKPYVSPRNAPATGMYRTAPPMHDIREAERREIVTEATIAKGDLVTLMQPTLEGPKRKMARVVEFKPGGKVELKLQAGGSTTVPTASVTKHVPPPETPYTVPVEMLPPHLRKQHEKHQAGEAGAQAAKEPWEMTQVSLSSKKAEEIFPLESKVEIRDGKPVYTYSTTVAFDGEQRTFTIDSRSQPNATTMVERLHKKIVELALSEGKPVPPEVLKDYPDLAAQAKPKEPSNGRFQVDEILEMRSPFTGDVVKVNYRGPTEPGKSMVWTGTSQIGVPNEWLSRPTSKPVAMTHVPTPKPEVPIVLTLADLQRIEAERSPRSQMADLRGQHSVVIDADSLRARTWARNSGSMDIKGIDTPNKTKYQMIQKKKHHEKTHKGKSHRGKAGHVSIASVK